MRFFAEFILSEKLRFFASLRMTSRRTQNDARRRTQNDTGEGLRITNKGVF